MTQSLHEELTEKLTVQEQLTLRSILNNASFSILLHLSGAEKYATLEELWGVYKEVEASFPE